MDQYSSGFSALILAPRDLFRTLVTNEAAASH